MTRRYKPEGMAVHTAENKLLTSSRTGIEKAMTNGYILEETAVMCDGDLNLYFNLGGIRGVMPKSEVQLCRSEEQIKDIAVITRVGKPVCFKITSFDGTTALLSRREAQRECAANYLCDLIPGDIIPVKITHLESFGAFADIGCGVTSLLPVDCLSVSRISHPRDRLICGSYVYAVIKSSDPENGRIFLTQKELLGTWEQNAAQFSVGQTVAGTVRSIENYGVFLELTPNLAGLAEPRGDFLPYELNIGDTAAVYIKSIIPERMKIKLVLIDTHAPTHQLSSLKYYIDCEKTSHINSWRYSPSGSAKIIESIFDAC